jgi:hypothetical protein
MFSQRNLIYVTYTKSSLHLPTTYTSSLLHLPSVYTYVLHAQEATDITRKEE